MTSLKFAANLSFLFQEIGPLPARYAAAKKAGFTGVECAFPYGCNVDDLKNAKEEAGVTQALINGYQGDPKKNEAGIAALPGREKEFIDNLEVSINFAKALQCPRMHIMAGKVDGHNQDIMRKTFVKNLQYAADRLSKENIVAVIEPINRITVPQYYLHNSVQALQIIEDVGHSNLRLQCDIFHWQLFGGNLTNLIKEHFHLIEHFQIAQVPERGPPDSDGEINYSYVFRLLEKLGYKGWIGCEYKPPTGKRTDETLNWLRS